MKRRRLTKAHDQKSSARLDLFGPPPVIEGEDAAMYAAMYNELLARIRNAVKPDDTIDEMLVADVVQLEWEILRWRRLKTSLIQACRLEALDTFLRGNLHYDLYSDLFADQLTEVIQQTLPKDQADVAKKLAHDYARDEPDAVDKVNTILMRIGQPLFIILSRAQAHEAKDVMEKYVRHESDAVMLVDEHLADAGTSIESLLASALAKNLDDIERIDRLTTVAEGRRNASLREIDRRRMVLREILRRTVQEVEAEEPKLLDPPAKGKKAA